MLSNEHNLLRGRKGKGGDRAFLWVLAFYLCIIYFIRGKILFHFCSSFTLRKFLISELFQARSFFQLKKLKALVVFDNGDPLFLSNFITNIKGTILFICDDFGLIFSWKQRIGKSFSSFSFSAFLGFSFLATSLFFYFSGVICFFFVFFFHLRR
jgi:hypothetical protein